jgi:hypothetical protein
MASSGADTRILDAGNSRRGTPKQVFVALLLGCAVAVMFGSAPLVGWTKDLPDGAVTSQVQDAAVAWDRTLSRFGADRPYAWLHGMVRRMRARD